MVNRLTETERDRIEALSPEQRTQLIERLWEEGQLENFKQRVEKTKEVEQTPSQEIPQKETPSQTTTEQAPSLPEREKTPKQETTQVPETPKRTTTPSQEETPSKETAQPTIDRNIIRQAFEVGAARWLDVDETIENVKTGLEKRGLDTSTFEQDNEKLISTFSQFNNSPDSFFAWLQQGETYSKVVQNSPSYKAAEKRFNNFNSIDKSETWLRTSLKSGKLNKDSALYKDLMNVPEYASILKEARKEQIQKEIKDVKNVWKLTNEQFDILIQSKIDKYVLDVDDIEEDLNSDEVLKENREWYTKAASELDWLYQERKRIRDKIDNKYPNATEAFKSALYNREVSSINDKISEKTEEASLYMNWYNLRLGEKEIVYDAKQAQSQQQLQIFGQMLNTYNQERARINTKEMEEFRVEQAIYQTKEISRIAREDNNKNVVEWQYNDEWNLIGLNQEGKTIITKSNLQKESEDGDFSVTKSKRADGWEDVYIFNKNTGNLSRVSKWVDWENVIEVDWAKKQWNITSYWQRVDGDYWLDIAVEKGKDITSPFNSYVVDKGFNETFWHYITIEDEYGSKTRVAHLESESKWAVWEAVWVGQTLWQAWNSWYVLTSRDGELREPTKEELEAGYGSHLDITTWKPDGTVRSWFETETYLNGYEETPSKYSAADINKALSQVPITLRNAVWEKEQYIKIATEELDKNGWDISSALLGVAGWNVTNNNDLSAPLEKILKTQSLWDSFNYAWVSASISNNDKSVQGNGIQRIENAVISNNPDTANQSFSNKAKVDNTVRKVNSLLSQVENILWEENFGKWDGTIENAKQFFWDVRKNKEAAKAFSTFKADVEQLFWPIRVETFGANFTENEAKFLSNFLPDVTDTSVSITSKLESLKNNTLSSYNSARRTSWLPIVNEKQLLDVSYLPSLYINSKSEPIWKKAIDTDIWQEELDELDLLFNE